MPPPYTSLAPDPGVCPLPTRHWPQMGGGPAGRAVNLRAKGGRFARSLTVRLPGLDTDIKPLLSHSLPLENSILPPNIYGRRKSARVEGCLLSPY
eukprot:840463-Pyramimonas_sp.AAC.1